MYFGNKTIKSLPTAVEFALIFVERTAMPHINAEKNWAARDSINWDTLARIKVVISVPATETQSLYSLQWRPGPHTINDFSGRGDNDSKYGCQRDENCETEDVGPNDCTRALGVSTEVAGVEG
jgi:hypothetical protein